MLMIVTVQTKQFPVTAIFRIVGMVVIDVMNRQFAKVRVHELPRAASTYPGIEFQGFFTVAAFQLRIVLRDNCHN